MGRVQRQGRWSEKQERLDLLSVERESLIPVVRMPRINSWHGRIKQDWQKVAMLLSSWSDPYVALTRSRI